MAHHQEPDGLQAQLAGQPEVLDRDVGLGAVGGDAADLSAVVLSGTDVVLVPRPGSIRNAILARLAVSAAALISCCSGVLENHS